MKKTIKNGFTLIELIIVMVILGIMASVAIPRYLDSISNAEQSAEDAVVRSIRSGLRQYANNALYKNGREEWPENPFSVLKEAPAILDTTNDIIAEIDDQWTFIRGEFFYQGEYYPGKITHQRADNSRFQWYYTRGTSEEEDSDSAGEGTLSIRNGIE
jgi:prepilin-type N-terminal cleavage/methylation domain-containing protein